MPEANSEQTLEDLILTNSPSIEIPLEVGSPDRLVAHLGPCSKRDSFEDTSCKIEAHLDQELLDAYMIAEIQLAETPQKQSLLVEAYVDRQAQQIDAAEQGLDEILLVLKKRQSDSETGSSDAGSSEEETGD